MLGYHVPAPDQAMIISGGNSGEGGLPFRIVVGHGTWVLPLFRRTSFLTLAMREATVVEDCVSQQGITLSVRAVIAFKVGSDNASIAAAAQRFLANQNQMDELTGQIFAGHLRSIVGSMTVEAIIRERQTLAENVLDASKVEMARIGLAVDSLQIQSIDDKGSGYIKALAAPHQATVNQAAQIAQAAADQASAMARQESDRNQAEYARQTAVARAQYQAEIDIAQQKASQAGPLAAAQAQQAVLAEQALVAQKNAELREAQLIAEVIKPAQAEAERIRTLAEAQAAATRLSAEAAAAENGIALDQAIIAQLPDLVRAAASGLNGANVTVLDGAQGLNGAVASLAGQGLTILESVRKGLGSSAVEGGSSPALG
ncbi:SPFH domain/Band 7 family protein [Motilibacter rhizosphaerae]|uniref:SPFH domain/Band 7 family protein n=1 Tax=Motilibacter rhizosphaerae TaxID=598652 RepID=A0A4Q7NX85_9ACTN|nr:flotillin family protein [Motilibacter rhizosphaerae]RZS91834.1 SPFH domain/Band 7 family protein [Motilibacter rhizosphaerae]